MKKIVASLITILLILALCVYSVHRVDRVCREATGLLREAETYCLLGDYDGAKEIVRLSQAVWQKNEGFLGVALRHTESDDIDILYPGLIESCALEDGEEFILRNLELIAVYKQLARMEQPYLFNIL